MADAMVDIVIGSGPPFENIRRYPFSLGRTIKVGLKNGLPTRITGCEISVETITGRLAHKCPVTVINGLSINPGATVYVELFSMNEALTGPPLDAPHSIRAHFPINPLPSADNRSFIDDQPCELTLLVTTAQTNAVRKKCRLFVEHGTLKLEPI